MENKNIPSSSKKVWKRGKNGIKNTRVKYETKSTVVGLISAIFIFTLNLSGLYTCLKRQRSLTSPPFYSTLYLNN